MDKINKVLRAIFILYILFIAYMSFYPTPPSTPSSDKMNHFLAFLLFAVLLRLSFKFGYWATFLFSVFYGSFIEIVQYFLPYRSAEYADLVADAFGALCGMFFIFVIELGMSILKEEKV